MMQAKKAKRFIRDYSVRLLLRGFVVVVFFTPLCFLRFPSAILGRLFYLISIVYRRLALENLRIAFSKKNQLELQAIAKRSFNFLVNNGLDTMWFITRPGSRRNSFVSIRGRKLLDEALDKKKGVIAVTAHIGAFTILGGVLTSYSYRANYILRTPRDEKMSGLLSKGLGMQQVRPIFTNPAIKCVNESVNALRRNEILIILLDQDIGHSGVFINFFGRPASTPVGPLILSLRTGAIILPMFMLKENNRHKLIVHPEFKPIYGENTEKTVLENTQRLTELVEDVIYRYPEQWSWIDRRWKTQMKPRLTKG